MPNTPPLTGQHNFTGNAQGIAPEWVEANALSFIAERAAGIEWQLVQLNQYLHRIAMQFPGPTNP